MIVVEEGMRIDTTTGYVLGPNLVPEEYNPDASPLYIYNRSLRFWALCRKHMESPKQIAVVVSKFGELEEVWDSTKDKYKPRKYFLSQKLLCKELCKHFKYDCNIVKAINDSKRRANQLRIYKDLFDSIKTTWRQESILESNRSNINFARQPNCHWQAGTLQDIQLGTHEQLMILARRWLSSLE